MWDGAITKLAYESCRPGFVDDSRFDTKRGWWLGLGVTHVHVDERVSLLIP